MLLSGEPGLVPLHHKDWPLPLLGPPIWLYKELCFEKKNVTDWWHNSQLEEYQTTEDPAALLGLFLGHYRILFSRRSPDSSSADYSWVPIICLEGLSTVITSPCTGWRRRLSNQPFWHEPGIKLNIKNLPSFKGSYTLFHYSCWQQGH